jgi:hypothetical protein
MVMLLTVRFVVQHVEFSRSEWLCTCRADETGLVIPASEATICGRDALANDWLTASLAIPAGRHVARASANDLNTLG